MKTIFHFLSVIISSALLLIPVSAPGGQEKPRLMFGQPVKIGSMSDPVLGEVSGIFASRHPNQVLWMVNDSGNAPALYAVNRNGSLEAEYTVAGVQNTDWEDLSGFRHNDRSYLVIADVGDNKSRRNQYTLLFLKEPVPGQIKAKLQCRWQMRFQYEDGPRDCESVAVDIVNQKILLLSKREKYPVLYELPLILPPEDTLYTAKPVARIKTLPQPTPSDLTYKYGKYSSRPTSMDISCDGNTLIILTYKHAYRFHKSQDKDWQQALLSSPELIRLPLPVTGELIQREALCIDHRTGNIIVTTEQLPAPIYTLEPVK